jgi:hypothetical protein
MKLDAQWSMILKRAWSVRFIALAGLLSATEVVLPMFEHDIPRNLFAVLSLIFIASAFIARVIVQKDLL